MATVFREPTSNRNIQPARVIKRLRSSSQADGEGVRRCGTGMQAFGLRGEFKRWNERLIRRGQRSS